MQMEAVRESRTKEGGFPDSLAASGGAGKRAPGGVLFPAKQREDAFLLILNRLLTRSPLFLGTWIGSSLLKDVL